MSKIKLYNSATNNYEEVPAAIARQRLKWRHIRQGGIYCLESEVDSLIQVPPAPAELTIVEAKTEPILDPTATRAEQPEERTSVLVTGSAEDQPKKRGRKPKNSNQ